ncbi:MAG TPA: SBBP repeat-containing protein [Bryobacteraceae bacterium]|jgi:uncharacterized repeat protein (TIGR01451 family)|nr:SBBP repeat-containing protein [Bryobacteraceae bacterium]
MTRDARAYFFKDRVVYKIHGLAIQAEFLGVSTNIHPQGEEPQAAVVNFLVGNQPQDWWTNLPTYGRVVYHGIYRGIDLEFGFAGSRLKSEYAIAPGGDPSLIRLSYTGLGPPDIDAQGDLRFRSELGEFREDRPAAFQWIGSTRIDVPAEYKILKDGGVGFELGGYDPTLPLIIDPVVVYSSYYGAQGDTAATAVAVDSNGNAYVTGWTDSTDLPTSSSVQGFNAGSVDAFVMKLNSAGNTLLYATYIGGSGDDRGYGIAVDGGGNAYVTGTTTSGNFPLKVPLQSTLSGGRDAFVLKLNAAGDSLTFSTYLGGAGTETGYGIALDSQGNAYVTGDTTSSNFPTLTPFQASNGGGQDAFVSKITPAGVMVYSTYLGGSGNEHAAAISVDSSGSAYITGGTFSTNFPTATPFQAANAGGQDAFVTKLSSGGNSLVYSTYLGGSGGALGAPEAGAGIAVDTLGHAFVVGSTSSMNFPLAAAVQLVFGGGAMNAFISEFNAFGTGLVYSTYFGGSTQDYGQAIAVDLAGNTYVAGYTGSADMPTVAPLQVSLLGSYNAFALIIGPSGAALNFATYYGGSGLDAANGVALDPSGNMLVVGQTSSANFPIVGGVQASLLGSFEAFLVKLNPGIAQPDFTLSMSPSSQNVAPGGNVNYTVTVTAVNGFTGAVNFGVSGLPAGVTGTFNPTSIVGSGTTTLTVSAALGAQVGSSTATVTGTSGTDSHSTSASLVVSSPSTASFVKLDTTTQGNWIGVYGTDGYVVIGDLTLNPSYVTPVASGETQAVWVASTSDVRALQKASNPADRVAGLWWTYNTFTIDLNITDSNTHQVALYCLDWDSTARREKVDVLDANGNVLNTQSLTSSFNAGVYLVWNLSGHVKLRVTVTGGPNAVATGLFVSTVSANPVLSISKMHAGNFTQGQQNATYTVKVSNPSGAGATSGTVTMTETVPSGLTLVSMLGTGWTCVSTNCTRSDALAGGSSYPAITATVKVAANATSPQVNQVSASGGGSATANASDSTLVGSNSSATFVKLDTTTQGSWIGAYGADGYIVIGDLTLNPSYVTPVASGETQAVWVASTSDVRALQKASNPADRVAGLWWTYNTFTIDLNITDSNTHQVALYCLDWDSTARREKVDVLDANGNVLNTQSLTSSFNGGVYLVWNLSGHVQLRVTVTGGPNAVATGLFLSPLAGTAPVLSISKTHSGNFTQAQQNATYTVTVSNASGAAATSGTVTMTETVPSGLTLVSISGTGWTCVSTSCTRSDALAGGSSYPAITATVNVAANATSPQVNQVSAAGAGSATANASDSTVVISKGSAATFVKQDTTTQGSWKGVYGADGYVVIGDLTLNSSYVTPVASGETQAVWVASTSDVRALQKASNPADRVAGLWWTYNTFTIDLNITDANTHQVALYCLDWDSSARREKVDVLDANGNVLNTQSLISSFNGGVYLVWNLSGHVQLRVTQTGGPNAVVTGLFLSPLAGTAPVLSVGKTHSGNFTQAQQNATYTVTVSNASGAAATSGTVTMTETVPSGLTLVSMLGTGWTCVSTNCTRSDALAGGSSYPAITATVNVAANATSPQVNQVSATGAGSATANASDSTVVISKGAAATFVKLDTTTQGSWHGVYGADGYVVIGDLTLNPSYVTPVASGETQAVWVASTSDVRALQKPSNLSDRIAGLWWTYNTFTVDVNITDANTHQVALYCLDWDSTARREKVDVLDANGNVLNTQSLISSFNGGTYLVWNLSGHVQLRVTVTGGPNAVATGLFFH